MEKFADTFKSKHDDYSAIMVQALGDRIAEALAEMMHKKAREKWGYGEDEDLSYEDLIKEKYRGIRPAPGYPACPDHTEKTILWKLLNAEKNIDVRLTETYAIYPPSSVAGLYFAHPKSKYFHVGDIGKDQACNLVDRFAGGDEGERGGDDLIVRLDSGRHQRKPQRVGPAVQGHTMFHPAKVSKVSFES